MGYCTWAGVNEANRIYHDTEWGIPVHDDRHMFEHLTLECLQCGLSWDLMLKKREIFRQCFDNFEYDKIAAYDDADVISGAFPETEPSCTRDMTWGRFLSATVSLTASAKT